MDDSSLKTYAIVKGNNIFSVIIVWLYYSIIICLLIFCIACCPFVSHLSLFVHNIDDKSTILFLQPQRPSACALCSTHSPPPEGVCIGVEVCVDVFLCQVDQEGGKDQDQETYIPSCNQLLGERQRGRYQSHLSAAATASSLAVVIVSLSSLSAIIITFGFYFDSAPRLCLRGQLMHQFIITTV